MDLKVCCSNEYTGELNDCLDKLEREFKRIKYMDLKELEKEKERIEFEILSTNEYIEGLSSEIYDLEDSIYDLEEELKQIDKLIDSFKPEEQCENQIYLFEDNE